jgi:hypothetical protein
MSGTVSTGGRTLRESPSARFAGGMVVGGRGPRDTPLGTVPAVPEHSLTCGNVLLWPGQSATEDVPAVPALSNSLSRCRGRGEDRL